jgi:hypothetical protein
MLTTTLPRFVRRYRASFVCFALATVLGLSAIADHVNKDSRTDKAELQEWYCEHNRTHCGGPSPKRIEEQWETRELGYKIAVPGLYGFAILLFVGRRLRP